MTQIIDCEGELVHFEIFCLSFVFMKQERIMAGNQDDIFFNLISGCTFHPQFKNSVLLKSTYYYACIIECNAN